MVADPGRLDPLLGAARPRTLAELRVDGILTHDRIYDAPVARTGREIRCVVDLLLAGQGPTLPHCSAGKDRTRVAIAVQLRPADVTREAIVTDFVRAAAAMPAVELRRVAAGSATEEEVAAAVPGSAIAIPEIIDKAHDLLADEPAGVRG